MNFHFYLFLVNTVSTIRRVQALGGLTTNHRETRNKTFDTGKYPCTHMAL